MAYGMTAFNIDGDMSVDRCVCCGSYVPEGRHVCVVCSGDLYHKDTSADDVAMVRWLSAMSEREIADAMQKEKKRFNFHHILLRRIKKTDTEYSV